MGRQKRDGKIMFKCARAINLIEFVSKFLILTHTEILNYFNTLTQEEVDFVSKSMLHF